MQTRPLRLNWKPRPNPCLDRMLRPTPKLCSKMKPCPNPKLRPKMEALPAPAQRRDQTLVAGRVRAKPGLMR